MNRTTKYVKPKHQTPRFVGLGRNKVAPEVGGTNLHNQADTHGPLSENASSDGAAVPDTPQLRYFPSISTLGSRSTVQIPKAKWSGGGPAKNVDTKTQIIFPPNKIGLKESRPQMNLDKLPPPKKPETPPVPGGKSESNKATTYAEEFRRSKSEKKGVKKYHGPISYEVHKVELPWLVQLFATIAPFWEGCMYIMGLSSYFIITVLSVFSFYVSELYDVVLVVDVIFGVDSFLRVLIELWRFNSGVPCIIFITPYTFTQFIADMFTIIPLERAYVYLYGSDLDNVETLKWFDYFRYNRFIRLKRLFSFLTSALREQRISERVEFSIWYFTCILGFIQFICCVFFYFLDADPIDIIMKRTGGLENSWLAQLNDVKPGYEDNALHQYIISLSFSTAVVTTVGYGDVNPTAEWEMGLAIAAMLFGGIFLTGLFSSGLTSFELEHDGARFDLFYRVEAVMKHLVEIKTTPFYRNKVLEYYSLLWNYREGVYNVELFNQLPKTMQEEILFDICQEMFHKSALFHGLEESFLRALARIVKPVLYNPNMILCTIGKYAMQMIYIIQGEVLVRSKYKSNQAAAVLRPGCIFGEINLFFSYPYTTNVETRTCCQLLVLEKETLFELLSLYPLTLEVLRQRVQDRLQNLHEHYKVVGEVPLYWTEYNVPLYTSNEDPLNRSHVFPVTFRKGTGWNRIVTHDILDDSRDLIIVEMPCTDDNLAKVHTTIYRTAVIPNILVSDNKWVKRWHITIMLLGIYGAFLSPYCLVFKATSHLEQMICDIDARYFEWVVSILFVLDVFVEIANAAPVTGYYYKFTDGFGLKRTQVSFWFDVLAAIPLNLIGTFMGSLSESRLRSISVTGTILRALKVWKVVRYFNYLDNKYYNRLFFTRLVQTLTVLLYATHFMACIVFTMACPAKSRYDAPKCSEYSWLRSYEVKDDTKEEWSYIHLSRSMPYLLSFYFAGATLSSAGFGDFNPQTVNEIQLVIFFELISFTIIGYYTAILTSALSCTIRPQLVFQQTLLGIKQFMEHQGISEDLQHRIIEHYHLQNLLWSGVTLPEKVYHFMYDAPSYLSEDALVLDVDVTFEGVPLLTKVEPKIIASIAELVRRYLIPPGTVFLRKGEVRRQMYIIGKGSVGILGDKNLNTERILETTSHFGIRDLLFGEPAHNHIKTLSYCLLYEIEYHDLDNLFDKEPNLVKLLEREKAANQKDIDAMTKEYAKFRTNYKEKPKSIDSWILFPSGPTGALNEFACSYAEYCEVIKPLRFKWVYKILLNKTVNPNGVFAKFWISCMSIVSSIVFVLILVESFMGERKIQFRILQYTLDMINYVDIYINLHWGFYTENNVYVSHPVRTALHYIFEGGFFFDLLFSAPFEIISPLITGTHILGYSKGVYWYSKMRWTRLPQICRIPAIVSVCNNIFTMRNQILVLVYVALTLVLCTVTSCFAFYIACPISAKIWEEGDENKLPFCLTDSWASMKEGVTLVGMMERLVYGIYYTSNVIFAIGFGDLLSLRRSELVLLIIMMVFGFTVDVCILANITAAEVDIDENRAKFLQSKECLEYILYKEKVNHRLRKIIREHLQHTWLMSKGLQPKTLFVDLHPALESGEQIMREGNLESEMYVIVAGKVWITDSDSEWICTLRGGETFGESSMLYKVQRSYSAFAGSAVEAFCLASSDYKEVLERYPIVEQHMEQRAPEAQGDVFESRIKLAFGVEERRGQLTSNVVPKSKSARANKINDYIQSKLLVDPGERDPRLDAETLIIRCTSQLIGAGTEDENVPFIYFAKHSSSSSATILIHPECGFMKCLSYVVVFMSFFTPLMSTYEMSFTDLTENYVFKEDIILMWFHLAGEIPMYLHICLQFVTPFRIGETLQFCKEPRKIVYNYVMSPSRFLFDILALFPIPFIQRLPARSALKWFHLLRAFRLVHFYKALVQKKDDLRSGIFFYKISVSLSTFLLIIHVVSCLVYEVSRCYCKKGVGDCTHYFSETCPPGTWTRKLTDDYQYYKLSQMTPIQWYTRSFYWVTSTVSTTGFGDIVPYTITEIIVATLCTFVGAFILAIILSQFTSGISSRGKAHREYLYQVNLLSKHLGNIGTSDSRREQVRAYFVSLWENSRGVPYHEAVSILPFAMQIEVSFFLYYNAIKNSTLFYRIDDKTFLRQVCIRLKHTLLLPGSIIVNEGDQGNCLFFVFKGIVTGYRTDDDGVPRVVRQYRRGDAFGKYPALFYDQAYTKTYRTETTTEVLSLSQDDIVELKVFEEFSESLQFVIIRKYNPQENIECIFQKRLKRRGLFSLEAGVTLTGEAVNLFEESKREIERARKQKGIDGSNTSISSSSSEEQINPNPGEHMKKQKAGKSSGTKKSKRVPGPKSKKRKGRKKSNPKRANKSKKK